ncbi:MAG: DNA replication and repair protein RecF [candidate division WS6 bacterium OLB20]|uniref:DNA replication and repair protein RecF n=1 Tax=candidate division WS6 bacterium OLB20 TaxID=1617426 RepID=A0A136LYP4_9BACT|nr:MAG: DNA replication and repair protein RecF [candidate division WS6 bacterium OLB20]
MILTKLTLKNYRRFGDRSFRFSAGINIVLGNNEAGKSTITQAIMDVLFADPSSRARALKNRITAWQGDTDAYLALEFEQSGEEWILEKDFGKGEARLVNTTRKETFEGSDAVSAKLADLLPFSSDTMYTATAAIRQSDIASIRTDKDFTAALQNAVSSTGEGGVVTILATLEDTLKDLRKGTDRLAKNPGPIKAAQDEVEHLEQELAQKRSQWEKVSAARDEGDKSGSRLHEINQSIEELELLLANVKKREEAESRLADLTKRLHEIQNILSQSSDLSMKQEQLKGRLDQYSQFGSQGVEETGRRITALSEQRQSIRHELEMMPVPQAPPPQVQQSFLRTYQHMLVALAVFVLGGIMAVVLESAVVAGIGSLIAVVLFIVLRVQGETGEAQRQALEQLVQQRAYKQKALDDAGTELSELLKKIQSGIGRGFLR